MALLSKGFQSDKERRREDPLAQEEDRMKLIGMVLQAAIEWLGRWHQPRLRSSPTAQVMN